MLQTEEIKAGKPNPNVGGVSRAHRVAMVGAPSDAGGGDSLRECVLWV